MLTRPLAAILAAAVLAACSDSGGTDPDIADPDQLDLVIVSGDGQVAPVADPLAGSAAFSPAQTTPDNLLPEPLVARITVDGAEPSAAVAAGTGGPLFAALPSNVSVTFRVVEHPEETPLRHCGDSFVASAIPDDSGYVVTYWERGTLAATCTMEVRLIVDGVPRVDTMFTATFEPGPAERLRFSASDWACVGDTLNLRDLVAGAIDRYGNAIGADAIRATNPTDVLWEWKEESPGDDATGPSGAGWIVEVPDFASYGFTRRTRDYVDPDPDRDYYSAYLHVQIGDIEPATGWSDDVFVPEDCPHP
ncbi:MAG TPA: hypothetical protein VF158_11350 [Longimicrobiales bacterium]